MKYSEEEKAMWLEDWKRSGKKAWAYAKENELIPQTFCSWAKRGIKSKADFIEIKPKAIPIFSATVIIIEKGDIKIHIPLSIGINELETILRSLRAAI